MTVEKRVRGKQGRLPIKGMVGWGFPTEDFPYRKIS